MLFYGSFLEFLRSRIAPPSLSPLGAAGVRRQKWWCCLLESKGSTCFNSDVDPNMVSTWGIYLLVLLKSVPHDLLSCQAFLDAFVTPTCSCSVCTGEPCRNRLLGILVPCLRFPLGESIWRWWWSDSTTPFRRFLEALGSLCCTLVPFCANSLMSLKVAVFAALRHCLYAEKKLRTFRTLPTSDVFFCVFLCKLSRGRNEAKKAHT